VRLRFLFSGLLALVAAPALAQPAQGPSGPPVTARDLAAFCAPPAGAPRAVEAVAFCHGYLMGAGQFHAATRPAGGSPGPLFCPPASPPTLAQAASAFSAWVQANPDHAGDRAIDGVARWAIATYPCPAEPAAPRRAGRRGA